MILNPILAVDFNLYFILNRHHPNRKFITYVDTHKGRSNAPVLATQQLASPYGSGSKSQLVVLIFIMY